MKILLISDSGVNENGGGFSQTLYNIFSFLKPDDFLLITSLQAYRIAPPSPPLDSRVLTYDLQIIPLQRNRFGKYVNSFITWFNYSVNDRLKRFKNICSAIKKFNADAVVVAPNGTEGVFIYYLIKDAFRNKKVFPYFMDDWLYQSKLKWFGGNIQLLAKQLLKENSAWLMISKNLADIFKNRYQLSPKRILEIHNPVDISTLPELKPVAQKDEYIFVYAGSIWQMHLDALLIMAKAIKYLKQTRRLRFIIYSSQSQWEWRKDNLKPFDIEYGGFIPYKSIHEKLKAADFLLLTSSFDKNLFTHTTASVQTKITDYLKAGRIIISCGPSYSVNHAFLQKYNCGICIETSDEKEVANRLIKILENPCIYTEYIKNGFAVLKENFSVEKVHYRLKEFLFNEKKIELFE